MRVIKIVTAAVLAAAVIRAIAWADSVEDYDAGGVFLTHALCLSMAALFGWLVTGLTER